MEMQVPQSFELMGKNRDTRKKGSSSVSRQNMYGNQPDGNDTGKRKTTLRSRVVKGGLPPVLSLAEKLPVPRTKAGGLDSTALGAQFSMKMEQTGYARCTISHARMVTRLLFETAASELGHPVTQRTDLLHKKVLQRLVEHLRVAPSGQRRLPILEHLVEYLHTGELTGRTAIPECEWIRSLRRPPKKPSRVPRPHYVIDMVPGVDHPHAIAFIEQLDRLNQRWQKRAKYCLRKFCAWLTEHCGEFAGAKPAGVDLRLVKTAHLKTFQGYLEACELKPGSVTVRMRELRRWFKFLFISRLIARDPAMSLRRLPAAKKPPRRIMSGDEVEQFLTQMAGYSSAPLVDVALFGCLSTLGLRPSEVAKLRVGDINFSSAKLTVLAKFNIERSISLSGTLLHAIERYLQSRADVIQPDSPLWLNQLGNPMSYETVRRRFHRFKKLVGMTRNVGGPHVFRRFFVTENLQAGYDLEDIQALKGDSNLRGLDPYDQTTDEEARIAFFRAMRVAGGGGQQ